MNKILVVTILATDRPGIVKTISETLVAHHASWIDSRMANLADRFAGLVQISVAEDQLPSLRTSLQSLHDADNQLHLMVEEANPKPESVITNHLSLEVVGADRPGIIDDLTGALIKLNVNINALESEQREASMSSELLFWAKLKLGLPQGVSNDDVQNALEALSDQLMVDIDLSVYP